MKLTILLNKKKTYCNLPIFCYRNGNNNTKAKHTMKVIDFPLERVEENRERGKLPVSSVSGVRRLFVVSFSYDAVVGSADGSGLINVKDVSKLKFMTFINRFPCFESVDTSCVYELVDLYHNDCLTDGQDRAIEAVLEMTSLYTFGFSVVDAFDIWELSDREAYLSIIKDFSDVHQDN